VVYVSEGAEEDEQDGDYSRSGRVSAVSVGGAEMGAKVGASERARSGGQRAMGNREAALGGMVRMEYER
jgi:hypothetical protein